MKYLGLFAAAIVAFGIGNGAVAQTQANNESGTRIAAGSTQVQATQTGQVQQSTVPSVRVKTTAKKIGFRLQDWKTMHASSAEDARVTIATLTKLGCEVESNNHGNHIDVRYRCTDWKSMKLATDQLVNQWTTWCEAKGMETVVMNPPAATKKPTVKFRLPATRTVHLHDEAQAKQILNTLKLIGCEVSSHQHGDHMDATFGCPDWVTIELSSESNAHAWQKWLDESGFETQHTH